MLSTVLLSSLTFAQPRACRELFVAGLQAPVQRAEVLAAGRAGRHVFVRDGQSYEIFVNPGIPPDGPPSLSIVRAYPSKRRARETMRQLMYLLNAGWPVAELFGLTSDEIVLDMVEGPNLASVLADPSYATPLRYAWDEFTRAFESWAVAHGVHVKRRGDGVHAWGSFRRRRLDFDLRPEHVAVDLIHRRLVITDLDAN